MLSLITFSEKKKRKTVLAKYIYDSVVKNPPATQETREMWVRSLGHEDPLEVQKATHSSTLARKIP